MIKLKIPETSRYKFDFITMSDIAFNLLTFTMLSLSSVEQNIITVDTPKSSVNTKEISEFIVIIDCEKNLYFKNSKINILDLYGLLINSYKKENESTLIIQADKNVSIDLIVQIGEIATNANMKIAIATTEKDENQ